MRRLSEVATLLLALVGLVALVVGVGMIYVPAAFIVGGSAILAAAVGWELTG